MDLKDIEAKLKKVQLVKDIEHALLALDAGVKHDALVSAIVAEDASEGERSVRIAFDVDESRAIFEAAKDGLQSRHANLMAELGG